MDYTQLARFADFRIHFNNIVSHTSPRFYIASQKQYVQLRVLLGNAVLSLGLYSLAFPPKNRVSLSEVCLANWSKCQPIFFFFVIIFCCHADAMRKRASVGEGKNIFCENFTPAFRPIRPLGQRKPHNFRLKIAHGPNACCLKNGGRAGAIEVDFRSAE